MGLSEVEQKIYDYYQFFHQVAPGVRVHEVGQLAQWWSYVDANAVD